MYEEDIENRCNEINNVMKHHSKKVNVNCRYQAALGEEIPLLLASQKGYYNIVKLLIHYKANVNIKTTFDHQTALHKSVIHNHPEIVKLQFFFYY